MKQFIPILCLVLGLTACSKSNSDAEPQFNTPSSPVPEALRTGTWFTGTISPISYYDRDGHNLGSEYEAGREFTFDNNNGKGKMKFWQYLGLRTSSSCTTEHYTYKEGTIVFDGELFTFYPVKGNFKTVKAGCSSGNGTTPREASGDDLEPFSFRWEIKNLQGIPHLYTYEVDDVARENPVFVYEQVK